MFFVSFCLVLASSYFLTTFIKSEKSQDNILYWIFVSICQLIITTEALSLFTALTATNLLLFNAIVFVFCLSIWLLNKKPQMTVWNGDWISKTKKAVKKDKCLLILAIFFAFATIMSFIIAIVSPANQWDGMAYHLARIGFWIQNHAIGQYESSCIRQLIFPVNSEILMLWSMIFIGKDYLCQLVQYFAYLANLFMLWNFLDLCKISTRRKLWAIFILASLPTVILQSSSTQVDLILAFFLFSSLYFFTKGLLENNKKNIIFSALAFAVAIGTKSSIFFFIPAFGAAYLLLSIKALKKDFYKPILSFIAAFIPFFVIFASYMYVLNYLNFSNPIGLSSYVNEHSSNNMTFRFMLANFVRYNLAFIDFSGMDAAKNIIEIFILLKSFLFNLLNLSTSDGLIHADIQNFNFAIHENYSVLGPIGFLIILPILYMNFIPKGNLSNRKLLINITGLIGIIFLLTICACMGFTAWNLRYLTAFAVIISPLLVYSYDNKKYIIKMIIAVIAIFCFVKITTFNYMRPVFYYFHQNKSIFVNSREEILYSIRQNKRCFYSIMNFAKNNIPDNSKIALIFSEDDWFYPFFEINKTWKIYSLMYDNLEKKQNYQDYDYIIFSGDAQNIYPYDDNAKRSIDLNYDFSKLPENFKFETLLKSNPRADGYDYKFIVFRKQ
ncbi:MAG: glycosyltransferase family 39 protein [Candidatus Gastranaerophilales bacterium]|nr:glycosyltransferase family 39 protein [Candidatus Gastranaerophilales bacterium]